jgi:hypothetical protein
MLGNVSVLKEYLGITVSANCLNPVRTAVQAGRALKGMNTLMPLIASGCFLYVFSALVIAKSESSSDETISHMMR